MKYPFIRIWGQQRGSYPYYIDKQIEQARADNAPWNAIYRKEPEGIWVTVDDLGGDNPEQRKASFYRVAAQMAFDN